MSEENLTDVSALLSLQQQQQQQQQQQHEYQDVTIRYLFFPHGHRIFTRVGGGHPQSISREANKEKNF